MPAACPQRPRALTLGAAHARALTPCWPCRAKTPLANFSTGITILITLLWITPVFTNMSQNVQVGAGAWRFALQFDCTARVRSPSSRAPRHCSPAARLALPPAVAACRPLLPQLAA